MRIVPGILFMAILAMPGLISGRAAAQSYCIDGGEVCYDLTPATGLSPIAGSPMSLETRMIIGDFRLGSFVGPYPDFTSAGAGGAAMPNLFGVGFSHQSISEESVDLSYTELPFNYSLPLDDPRYAVVFDLPIGYTEGAIAGAGSWQVYSASLGAGVRLAMLDNWTITPTLRIGGLQISGLIDNGEYINLIGGASLVSNYWADIGDLEIAIGNQISYVGSLDDGGSGDSLSNTIFRNGIGLSGPTSQRLFDLPVTWEAAVVNTQFTGDPLFVDDMTEFAVSFGTQNSANGITWDSMRLGLTYTYADGPFDGFEINYGYRF